MTHVKCQTYIPIRNILNSVTVTLINVRTYFCHFGTFSLFVFVTDSIDLVTSQLSPQSASQQQ